MATILLIDDEEDFRKTAAFALRKAGYTVTEAANIADAQELAETELPDLIISDICMKGGDGFTLLNRIRSSRGTATLPFIFMSGHADRETLMLGAEQAADGILPKPFTVQTLLSIVAKRLNREVLSRQRTEEMRFQLLKILEAAPDLIAMVNPHDTSLEFLNATGRALIGLGPDEDVSRLTIEGIHADDKLRDLELTILPTAFQIGIWKGETLFKRLSGETFPVKECIQAHREPHGKCAYLSVIAHDLSESNRLEGERKAIELQLTQAHKLEAIGQLAAGIAHEINTPTQYIGDNTRFLQEAFGTLNSLLPKYQAVLSAAKQGKVTSEQVAELEQASREGDLEFLISEIPLAIQQTLEGVDRVTRIVRAMKDFSHPGGAEKNPVDLNHAIESTVTVARNEWKYVANVEFDLDKTLPLVPCFPGEINQLLLNLVVNAAHAIEEVVSKTPDAKGTITIRTAKLQNAVEIVVKDTGGGIPISIRKKIFDPFFTTKEVGKGTGQGLAIARSVMAKHGGTIDFESEVGQGTTFFVRLPLSSDDN